MTDNEGVRDGLTELGGASTFGTARPRDQRTADKRADVAYAATMMPSASWAEYMIHEYNALADRHEALMAQHDGGLHVCLTEEEGWRPCPSSLCEALTLLSQHRNALRDLEGIRHSQEPVPLHRLKPENWLLLQPLICEAITTALASIQEGETS